MTDAGCWSEGFSFSTCCFSRPAGCFDDIFTFERCCLVSSKELSFSEFRARWPALQRPLKGGRSWRWRRRWVHETAQLQLKRTWQQFTIGGGLMVAISELLAFYTLKVKTFRHDPTGMAMFASMARKERRTWRKLREQMEQMRVAPFEACACAGKGYDMLMAMRDNFKRLWLYHPNFKKFLTDTTEQAHHLSILQSCVDLQVSEEALFLFEHTSLQTNCVSGDVATNIAVAQACILQRQWTRAAELYLLAFALVVLAPWADCLSLPFWDMTANDVLYNAARLFTEAPSSWKHGGLYPPVAAIRKVAWRRSPYQLLPVQGLRCKGPAFVELCLDSGLILVPKGRGNDVECALCSEFGAFRNGLVKETTLDGMRITGAPEFQAFVIPVGTPFPNIWHALHWWVPALSLKEEQGWKADHLQVVLVFDIKPRHGGSPRWDIQRPQSDTMVSFSRFHQPIFSALSSHPVIVLEHLVHKVCFQQGTVGFKSFRYDMKDPQMNPSHVAFFRRALAGSGPMGLPKDQNMKEVLIINRALGSPRHISNLQLLESQIRRTKNLRTRLHALEAYSLLEQFTFASQADVLVGAHGAGLAWMVAMEPGSAVTELMPAVPGYVACVESWDHPRNLRHSIYGGLAHFLGQRHICVKGGRDDEHKWTT
eukprot:symbB.v1.2.038281.t1/scaffold5881.1/size22790/2